MPKEPTLASPSGPATVATFEQFAALAARDENIALGAALIARDVYPSLDVHQALCRLRELAEPLRSAGLARATASDQVRGLAEYLGEALGFRGNEQDYYDPRNSLLPDVLDRRLGIPISLSIVYCEVARELEIAAHGVNFPGHFIVRVGDPTSGDAAYADPFFGGRHLDRDDLTKLLRRHGPGQTLDETRHLSAADCTTTLVRMLINLKWIYASRGDSARALLALDRIISLTPDSAAALRERGLLALRLGALEAARADLSRLLELVPQAPDAGSIRDRLKELGARTSLLN